MLLMSFIYIV